MAPGPESTDHRQDEWLDYYRAFNYFSPAKVRHFCYPRCMRHPDPAERAVVLVHGLTDSPWFLMAIARHFFTKHGYDVYLPLLHMHGLREPQGMEGVELEEWQSNVRFAIDQAAEHSARVSVGGLSTGGVLSFYMACTKPKVTGDLFLFSAALDLAGGLWGLRGEMRERLGRSFLSRLLKRYMDEDTPLIGANPYRYDRMDNDGALELTRLLKGTDDLIKSFDVDHPFPKRVFAAHSEADKTADIQGIRDLQAVTPAERFVSFYLPKVLKVPHASVVLQTPILSETGEELEPANPQFAAMMQALDAFV